MCWREKNEETNQLLIENVLEASKFYEKHHVNSKDICICIYIHIHTHLSLSIYILGLCVTKLHCLLEVTLGHQQKWNLADGCISFCRIWKAKVCTSYHWYVLGVAMGNRIEFWEGWFCNFTFTGRKSWLLWRYLYKLRLTMPLHIII